MDGEIISKGEVNTLKRKLYKDTFRIKTNEFPNFNYLLNEARFTISHMDLVKDNITSSVSKLETLSTDAKKVLLKQINATFSKEHVSIKTIGTDLSYKILKALGIPGEEVQAEKQVSGSKDDDTNIDSFYICLQSDSPVPNKKILGHLEILPSYVRQYEIYVVDDQETNKDEKANAPRKDAFEEPFSCPVFTTITTLKKTLDEVLSETLYDLLDILVDASKGCLESSLLPTEKQNVLQEVIIDLTSLTQERPCRKTSRSPLECVPQDIHECLSGLKDQGVLAYSVYQNQLLIVVDIKTEESNIKKIKNVVPQKYKTFAIVYSESPIFKPHISNGDTIRPGEPDSVKYGTLGAFATAKNIGLVALTSGHVVKEEENVFTSDKEKLGKCIFGPGDIQHSSDLSVIKIDDNMRSRCETLYKKRNGELFDLTLFEGNKKDLAQNQRVFKIGATTGETRGMIVSEIVQPGITGEFLLIKGFHGPFSQGGDSGSVVCMPKTKNPSTLVALSMVFGGEPKLRKKGELQNGASNLQERLDETTETNVSQLQNTSCTFLLNETLKNIENDISVEFIRR